MKTCVTKVHRGVNWDHYGYGEREDDPTPIIDSAYVLLDFYPPENNHNKNDKFECGGETKYDQDSCAKPSEATYRQQAAMGCLELCMFAEGSRHQEEIIVTGLAGRVEAYMPENKVSAGYDSDRNYREVTIPSQSNIILAPYRQTSVRNNTPKGFLLPPPRSCKMA